MDDAQLRRLLGTPVAGGRAGRSRVFNHRWDDPATFAHLGAIPAREIEALTHGRLHEGLRGRSARLPPLPPAHEYRRLRQPSPSAASWTTSG